jgi:hypothetical protein
LRKLGNSTITSANIWLEGRYGWSILLREIADLSQALNTIGFGIVKNISKRATYTYTTPPEVFYLWLDAFPAYGNLEVNRFLGRRKEIPSKGELKRRRKDLLKITVRENISERGFVTAKAEIPGVRFNLLPTIWEVTRFSFVLDWAINVGQWLDAIVTRSLVGTEARLCLSRRVEQLITAEVIPNPEHRTGINPRKISNISRVYLQRTPINSVPWGLKLGPGLNLIKTIDLAAILAQLLSRGKR